MRDSRGVDAVSVRRRGSPLPLGVRAAFWVVCIGLGLVQAWQYRNYVHSDGLAYLDIGTAYWRGDWKTAVNAHWSPLYSWLLGLAMGVFKPPMLWEASVAHLLNVGLLAFVVGCFDFLLRELSRYEADRGAVSDDAAMIPAWALVVICYSVFMWSALDLITVYMVMPDLCVAGFIYAAFGLLVRLRRGASDWRTAALFGATLGLGYLAKSAMFPLAPIFLATAAFAVDRPARLRVVGTAAIGFLVVAGPYVAVISQAKGRLTFGESGRYNYARHVGGIVAPVHWHGEPLGTGTPIHPTRKILDSPSVYEFGEPVGGTYPPWHDPSYWYEGASYNFHVGRQLTVLARNLKLYAKLVLGEQLPSSQPLDRAGTALLLVLVYAGGKMVQSVRGLSDHWFVVIPAVAALGMYALVHVEPRYVAAYFTVLAITACFSLRVSRGHASRRLVTAVAAVILTVWVVPSCYAAARMLPTLLSGQDPQGEIFQWRIADALRRSNARPGDRFGFIGEEFRFHWARMVGGRVVAEIRQLRVPEREVIYADAKEVRAAAAAVPRDVDTFWEGDTRLRMRAMEAFRSAGASVIVADRVPDSAIAEGWVRITGTRYGFYFLGRDSRHVTSGAAVRQKRDRE